MRETVGINKRTRSEEGQAKARGFIFAGLEKLCQPKTHDDAGGRGILARTQHGGMQAVTHGLQESHRQEPLQEGVGSEAVPKALRDKAGTRLWVLEEPCAAKATKAADGFDLPHCAAQNEAGEDAESVEAMEPRAQGRWLQSPRV